MRSPGGPGAKTVAIGFDPTHSYSNQMSRAVRSRLESAGIEITAFEPVEPGAEDYSDTVKKLAAGNPDAVFYSVHFPEGALIAKATPSGGSSPTCLRGSRRLRLVRKLFSRHQP